jgi:hypothetical protein
VTTPALRFATDEELRVFERSISRFFWTQDFAGAEQVLLDALRAHPSSFSDICQTISQGAVSISGWDELYAQIEALARNGSRCTAIEIDLSGHADRDVQPDGALEPGFECSYYDDSTFHFSTASREEILSQCETGTMQWTGCFLDIDNALTCDGLAKLYSTLARYQHRYWRPRMAAPGSTAMEVPQDFVAFTLGRWFLYLRVHKALWSDLYTRGLPHRMPVVVGQHDFGPLLYSVYMSETTCNSSDASSLTPARRQAGDAASAILAERQAERSANFQSEINGAIAELRELYRLVRMFPFYRYKARNTLADQLTSQLKMWCQSQELPEVGVDWRMRKPDFERFLRQIAEARRVPSVDEALDVLHVNQLHDRWLRVARERDFDLGSRPTSLFELNLAWALKFGGPIVQDRWEHAKPYQAA